MKKAGRETVKDKKLVVIKIGSAVIADSDKLDISIINSLASQIAHIRIEQGIKSIVVSSGSVAAGKAILRKQGKNEYSNYDNARRALAAVGQSLLMQAWKNAFEPYDIVTAQVLLTRDDLRSRKRFQTAAETFSEILSWNVIPIVNENDTVSVHDIKFGDNDSLSSLLINLVGADLFINLTSAPGVYASNPETGPDLSVMEEIENIASLDIDGLCGSGTNLGSGGMRSKLLAARRVAQLGVPTFILPGRSKDILNKAVNNATSEGTWVWPEEKTIPRRKFWLAYQSEPAGIVEIDDGAANALIYEGRSLLPGGITSVNGSFEKGALVSILHKGQIIGAGFCNYPSEILKKIHGLKRHEVAAILGNAKYPDVIHRDNMLLDAAI